MDKAELLGAIAAGGTRAKEAYEQAQAALKAQNQEAVRAALSNSVAQSAPGGAAGQLTAQISQPYQNQGANLIGQQANAEDYFNRIGTSAGTYMDQASALIPALEKRYELELANKMALLAASGSGGGGGGGGGGGDEGDDFLALTKSLGGKENTKDYFSGFGDKYTARAKAIEAGIPEQIANSWFTPYASGDDEYFDIGSADIGNYLSGNLTVGGSKIRNIKQLRNYLRQGAATIPGNQHAVRRQLIQTAKKAGRKKKRK